MTILIKAFAFLSAFWPNNTYWIYINKNLYLIYVTPDSILKQHYRWKQIWLKYATVKQKNKGQSNFPTAVFIIPWYIEAGCVLSDVKCTMELWRELCLGLDNILEGIQVSNTTFIAILNDTYKIQYEQTAFCDSLQSNLTLIYLLNYYLTLAMTSSLHTYIKKKKNK